jgi:putative peptidoglycan lipid II flippase
MFSRQNLFQASLILTLAILAGRVVGFFREVVIANTYGASGAYDVYLVAITFPVVIFSLLSYSIPSVFIPIYSREKTTAGEQTAWAFFGNFTIIFAIIFFFLAALLFLFADTIIKGYSPSLESRHVVEAAAILRLVCVIVFLGGIYTVLKSMLNANKHFLLPAVTPLFLNISMILSVLLLAKRFSILALAIGLVGGHGVQTAVISWFSLKGRGVPKFSIDFRDKLLRRAFAVLPIILTIETIGQLNVVVDRFFISILPTGGLSALNYANTVYQIAIGAFGVTVGTVIFPTMSEYAVSENREKLIQLFSKAIRWVLVATIPVVLASLVFSREIVTVMFQRGAFDEQASLMTANALQCFSIGLAGFVSYIILAKIYYALHKELVLLAATGTALLLKVFLSRWLVQHYFHRGLALATSCAGIFSAMILALWLRRSMGRLDGRRILKTLSKLLISSTLSIGASKAVLELMERMGLVYRLGTALAFGSIVFIGLGYIFRIEEVKGLFRRILWQVLYRRSS